MLGDHRSKVNTEAELQHTNRSISQTSKGMSNESFAIDLETAYRDLSTLGYGVIEYLRHYD